MNITSLVLLPYDTCKQFNDPEICRQKAIDTTSKIINTSLQAYDQCTEISSSEICKKLLPEVDAQSYFNHFLVGLVLGVVIRGFFK